MRRTIKAGPAMDLAKHVVGRLFNGLDDLLRNVNKVGKKTSEENIKEEGIDGKYLRYETADGSILEVKLFAVEEHPDYFIVRVRIGEDDNTAQESKRPLRRSEVSRFITDYADSHGLGTVEEAVDVDDSSNTSADSVSQSTKMSVTLQRVSAGTEDTINLCAIRANNVISAMNILDEVLSDDEFVATITSEPVSFEITETDDAYDVQDISSVDTSNTFVEMLRACVECYHNLECIHWAAKGSKFKDIHSYTESLMWDIKYQTDTIAEWCVEFTKTAPNVLAYQYTPLDPSEGYGFESAMSATKGQIDDYVKVLECYYVNVDHDVQSVMDNWIRDLKKKSNYVLDRTLMPECTTECPHTL